MRRRRSTPSGALLGGALLVVLSALFALWVSLADATLEAERRSVVHALGGGVYLLAAAAAGFGALRGIARIELRSERGRWIWPQFAGAMLAGLALWGVAGAFSPDATLGGVELTQHSAGGRFGGALNSPIGWVFILGALAVAYALVWPTAARSLMQAAGREIREQGPTALMSLALWTCRVVLAPAIWLWRGLRWYAREVSGALGIVWQQPRIVLEQPPQPPPAPPVQPVDTLPQPMPEPMYQAQAAAMAAPQPAWPSLLESLPKEDTTPLPEPPFGAAPAEDAIEEDAATAEPEVEVDEESAPAAEPEPAPAKKRTKRTLKRKASDGWRLPPIDLLDEDPATTLRSGAEEQAQIIVDTLASFGVDATVPQINEGPSITQFGVQPGWDIKTRQVAVKDADGAPALDDEGKPVTQTEEVSRTRVRVSKITRLADDLALALAAPSIRIEAPVPGQPIVGVEVPNAETRIVALRGLIESPAFKEMASQGGLPIALGRDVTGNPVIADLTRMPHVLIAGATGSGKSVCINTIIASLLMQKSPEEVRLILVDPKRVELTGYGAAPHLAFSHVVTEPDEVVSVLGVVVAEMDRRYRHLEEHKARNIIAYNKLPSTERQMPYWVVVLDELADMMMAAAADVEGQLVRLAQLARAVGIHLVVATQRPSVDVVTGLIKANFPTRIAFATTSQTDARVILDRAGAEKLMGRGDMLFMSSDTIKPRRVQGAFVSDAEIERLLESWTAPDQGPDDEADDSIEGGSLDEVLSAISAESPAAEDEQQARAAQSDLRTLNETLETAMDADDPESDFEAEGESELVSEAVAEIETPDIVIEPSPEDVREDAPEPKPGIPAEPPVVVAATAQPAPPADSEELDSRLAEATELAQEYERVSAALLQRRMRVGRPRAERLIAQLEQAGVVEEASNGAQSRRVLSPVQELD